MGRLTTLHKLRSMMGVAGNRNSYMSHSRIEGMEKAERIDRVQNSMTEERLFRVMEEVSLIVDDGVREGVIDYFVNACP